MTRRSLQLALTLLTLSVTIGLGACDGDDVEGNNNANQAENNNNVNQNTNDNVNDNTNINDNTNTNQTEIEQVCTRWNSDRQDLSEGTWTGSVAGCEPGDVTTPGRENALRLINLYRWLADLPEATENPTLSATNQHCALMMHANGQLSHSPPTSWTCYTTEGADGAGSSNISSTPGVMAVDLYMLDTGNPTTLGHRRWILSNSLGGVGLGSTSEYSCMWVIGTGGSANAPWTAYPPPGVFPEEALSPIYWGHLDDTGWSVQSDPINLTGAQVTVSDGAGSLPVDVWNLASGYGSSTAIAFTPSGWSTQAGTTYHVEVSTSPLISYDVQVVDCTGY